MYNYIRTENIKAAHKEHYCDACISLIEIDTYENLIKEMTKEEINLFSKMKEQNFQILRGQPYTKVVGTWEGDICSSCYAIGMYEIAKKFGIFDE